MSANRILLILALLGTSLQASAQSEPDIKYWVFFSEKAPVAEKTAPITERALKRRLKRATTQGRDLDTPVTEAYVERLEGMGATVFVRSRWLNAVSVRMTAAEAARVRALPMVTRISPVGIGIGPTSDEGPIRPRFVPDMPHGPAALRLDYGISFAQLDMVNAIPGLESGINGSGVLLGIIDTDAGDLSHAALSHILTRGGLKGQRNFTGFPECRTDPSAGCDGSTHGQSVLSMAAGFAEGTLVGPAYGADVILAHTEYTPTETNQEEDNLVAALEWMESQGVDVINISLGYSTFDPGQISYTNASLDGDTAVSTRATDLAAALGVVIVSSAGNEGNGPWFFVTSPADGDSVIAVGAVDDIGRRASFSGHGPTADNRIKPDVSAMGQGVVIANSTGFTAGGNGTSFSSPMVAGIVAQILQVNSSLNPIEVRDILTSTATKALAPDNNLGYGIIDAEAALAAAAAMNLAVQPELPSTILSAHVYPNPSAGPTTLGLRLAVPSAVQVEVFDLLGRSVSRATWPTLSEGEHQLPLSLPPEAAGWYGFRVTAGNQIIHGTMSIVD